MVKAILFDLDNTLYDTKTLAQNARLNAVKAMVEAGLTCSVDEGFTKIAEIVAQYGSNYDNHFDRLLEEYGQDANPHIIAAGVVAYHETKKAYLVPFQDTIPTLLELRQRGMKIGVVSNGIPVKQWEKLIRLGVQHFFEAVVICEKDGKPSPTPLLTACENLEVDKAECLMVGDSIEKDVAAAKAAKIKSIQLISKNEDLEEEVEVEPDFLISKISEILPIIDSLK
jgi:putative hydrolase of the HAD superfamily